MLSILLLKENFDDLLSILTFDKAHQKNCVHEYQKELDKFSINMYMESGRTDLLIKSICFADDIQTSLKLAKEVLKTPRFRQDTLDKMKSELKDEILTSEKSAEDKLLFENDYKESGAKAVFVLEQGDLTLAKSVTERCGGEILTLDSCQTITKKELENNTGYVEIMKKNLTAIKEGLQ